MSRRTAVLPPPQVDVPADPAGQVVWTAPIGPSGALISVTSDEKTSSVDWYSGCGVLTDEERDADPPAALPMGMAEMRSMLGDLAARVATLEAGR